MNSVFFLVLRRMRAPLIVLIVIYAISVLGLTLVPGVDGDGRVTPPLSFFHAFYFISYTATTIGFGEIPAAFSDAQRLWVIVCIYLTVIGWSYSIVTLLALLQDQTFQGVLRTTRFARRVRFLQEPFYLVCGCGETGALVCRALDERGLRFVVVEREPQRVNELDLEDFQTDVPALAADAKQPRVLSLAGLTHRHCRGVLALTSDDSVNLSIAVAVRLLNPAVPVLARADRPATEANMASFGTQHIINPYGRFAEHLGEALEAPFRRHLIARLTGLPGEHLPPLQAPPAGRWVVCGHGRFSRPVISQLTGRAIDVTVITPEADGPAPPLRHIVGTGTEAGPLRQAGIEQAVGLVAGTDNDVNNLSIAMTAKELNPALYVVMRQNRVANAPLFRAFAARQTMVPSQIVAHECLAIIITPLLSPFLAAARVQDEAWAAGLCARLDALFCDLVPLVWSLTLDHDTAPAVLPALAGEPLVLAVLARNFEDRDVALDLIPLLLLRDGAATLLPGPDCELQAGDQLLYAGTAESRERQRMALRNGKVLDYLRTGRDRPAGWVWQWLARRGQG